MPRFSLALLLGLTAGCAGGEPDPEPSNDAGDCVDEDGDGYGVGDGCLGPDCNDANRDVPRIEDCPKGCDPDVHDIGCECDEAEFPDPEACYTGPAETEGVGRCEPGLRSCVDGTWSTCEDQVGPTGETCNYVDDDCDGDVDEGHESACGCGLTVGIDCDEPFAPGAGSSGGVEVDEGGALVLDGSDEGYYLHRFLEPCTGKANNPAWTTISWEAEVPDGASVSFEARTEPCSGDPGSEPWVQVASDPPDEPPVDMRPAFTEAGEPLPITCLGVRVTLHSDGAAATPRLHYFGANLTCR